jgi:hypothetical protein
LSPDTYRFHFGGNGRGYYYTDAVYDVTVQSTNLRDLTKDVSAQSAPPKPGPNAPISNQIGYNTLLKKFSHLKTEDDIHDISPFP